MQNADTHYSHDNPKTVIQKTYIHRLIYPLSFLIPFLTMLLIYAEMGIAPFGERSILLMDMSEQYVNFFSELQSIVRGDSSIYFSWGKSFGCSFIGVFAYYISSPLTFITVFFPPEDLPVVLMFLTCLKIGLAGFTLTVYFKAAFRKAGLLTLTLSLCYALMSYSFSYSLCIMWLDGLIWLPLILLGIEKLLAGHFPWILTLSLSVMFVSNYYISYMIGLFSALYFVYRFFSEKHRLSQGARLFVHFAAAVIIAAGLASWLLLPAGLDLMAGKLAQGPAIAEKGMNFMSVELFKRLWPGQYDGITYGLPYIFCGTMIPLLGILYFLNPRISVREKVLSYVFIRIMIISFCSKQLNFLWHGFQYPNWFPFRYSFVFSFLLIFLAFRAVTAIPFSELKRRLMSFEPKGRFLKSTGVYYMADKGIILFLILLLSWQTVDLYQNGKEIIKGLDRDFSYLSLRDYQNFYRELLPLVEQAEDNPGFFRMEKNFERGKNDALLLGYKGVTHYSSAFNHQVNRFTKQLGFAQGWMWNSYFGGTPLTDMLFNMRFIMSRTAMPDFYERAGENGGTVLYEHPAVLPAGFMAQDVSLIESHDFNAQNEMLSKVSGLERSYFTPCDITLLSDNQYRFTAQENAPHYLYIPLRDHGYGGIYANDVYRGDYATMETQCILYIGDYRQGEEVDIYVENDREPAEVTISSLNTDRLLEAFQIVNEGGLTVLESGADRIKGEVLAPYGGVMMTSIPYDPGFRVKVDGQKVSTVKAFDTFLGFRVPEGAHDISIRYFARGQIAGIIISLFSVILFACYRYIFNRFLIF